LSAINSKADSADVAGQIGCKDYLFAPEEVQRFNMLAELERLKSGLSEKSDRHPRCAGPDSRTSLD
jgi:hypothetical protein